jgi:hypothetical protein
MKKQAVQAPRDIKKSRMRKVPQEKSAKWARTHNTTHTKSV